MKLPNFAVIKEVGPRMAYKMKKIVGTKDKVKWIQLLTEAGLSYVEVSSFVHPKWVPALADANDVFSELKRIQMLHMLRLFRIKMVWNELLQNVDEVNVFISK